MLQTGIRITRVPGISRDVQGRDTGMVTISKGICKLDSVQMKRHAKAVRYLKAGFFIMAFLAIGSLIALGMLFDQSGSGDRSREQQKILR